MTNAVSTLLFRFKSELVTSGVLATDLFAFNSSLGATIEEKIVGPLNELISCRLARHCAVGTFQSDFELAASFHAIRVRSAACC